MRKPPRYRVPHWLARIFPPMARVGENPFTALQLEVATPGWWKKRAEALAGFAGIMVFAAIVGRNITSVFGNLGWFAAGLFLFVFLRRRRLVQIKLSPANFWRFRMAGFLAADPSILPLLSEVILTSFSGRSAAEAIAVEQVMVNRFYSLRYLCALYVYLFAAVGSMTSVFDPATALALGATAFLLVLLHRWLTVLGFNAFERRMDAMVLKAAALQDATMAGSRNILLGHAIGRNAFSMAGIYLGTPLFLAGAAVLTYFSASPTLQLLDRIGFDWLKASMLESPASGSFLLFVLCLMLPVSILRIIHARRVHRRHDRALARAAVILDARLSGAADPDSWRLALWLHDPARDPLAATPEAQEGWNPRDAACRITQAAPH